jgi:hypothetical protein
MVRLNQKQRTALGETLRQLGNLSAAALVLGQFVGNRPLSWRVLVAGAGAWVGFITFGLLLLREEES